MIPIPAINGPVVALLTLLYFLLVGVFLEEKRDQEDDE